MTVKATVLVVIAVMLGTLASATANVTSVRGVAVMGVPLTMPVVVSRLSPAGNVPDVMLYVYGVVPPVTLVNGEKLVIGVPTLRYCAVVTGVADIPGTTVTFTLAVDGVSAVAVRKKGAAPYGVAVTMMV